MCLALPQWELLALAAVAAGICPWLEGRGWVQGPPCPSQPRDV